MQSHMNVSSFVSTAGTYYLSLLETLDSASKIFISTFENEKTQLSYANTFKQFFSQGFLNPAMTLQEFSKLNLEVTLDNMRQNLCLQPSECPDPNMPKLAHEGTRQYRASIFTSFTYFLMRATNRVIRKASPQRTGTNMTYAHVKEKTVATCLTKDQIHNFFEGLKKMGQEQYLFGFIQLHAARKVSDVTKISIQDICFETNKIVFIPLRKRNRPGTSISAFFPQGFMDQLKAFIGDRTEGYLFIPVKPRRKSTESKPHIPESLARSWYQKAWKLAYPEEKFCPKSITHCLRATAISDYFEKGVNSNEIKKISGHVSLKNVMYYDFSGDADNPSRYIQLAPLL